MDTRYPQAHKLPREVKASLVAKVRTALDTNTRAVEHAIKVLFDRQTSAEKDRSTTLEDNNLGVKHCHARRIVYYGRWLASGRHLTGNHLEFARKIAHGYAASQLFELAAVKAGLVK